jgi:hypothetical protein
MLRGKIIVMSEARWIEDANGHLELVEPTTGQVLARQSRSLRPYTRRSQRKAGRPTKAELQGRKRLYDLSGSDLEQICEQIASGSALTEFGRSEDLLPSYRAVLGWRHDFKDFEEQIQAAMWLRYWMLADLAIEAGLNASDAPVDVARFNFEALKSMAGRFHPARSSRRRATR